MLVVIRQQRQQRQIKNHRIEMMFWFSLYRTIAWRLWRHIMPFNYLSEGVKINENTVLYLSICFDRFTGWLVGKTSPQRPRDSFHVVLSWLSTRCSPKVVEYIWCCACTCTCCILDAVLVLVLHLVLYSAKVLEYNNAPQAFPTRPRRDKVLRRNVIGNCVDHFFSSIFFPT